MPCQVAHRFCGFSVFCPNLETLLTFPSVIPGPRNPLTTYWASLIPLSLAHCPPRWRPLGDDSSSLSPRTYGTADCGSLDTGADVKASRFLKPNLLGSRLAMGEPVEGFDLPPRKPIPPSFDPASMTTIISFSDLHPRLRVWMGPNRPLPPPSLSSPSYLYSSQPLRAQLTT